MRDTIIGFTLAALLVTGFFCALLKMADEGDRRADAVRVTFAEVGR